MSIDLNPSPPPVSWAEKIKAALEAHAEPVKAKQLVSSVVARDGRVPDEEPALMAMLRTMLCQGADERWNRKPLWRKIDRGWYAAHKKEGAAV